MAWKAAGSIGGLNLSVPKEEYFEQYFLKQWSEHGTIIRPYDAYESLYVFKPLIMSKMFFGDLSIKEGDVIRLATLPNGLWLGSHITGRTVTNTNIYGSHQIFVYNPDGTKYSDKVVCHGQANVKNQYTPESGSPIYFSLLFNDETKEACFITLFSIGDYAQGCYYMNQTTYVPPVATLMPRTELYNILTGNLKEYDPDPWSDVGYSGTGGGDGTFNFTSDIVGLPSIPNVDATSTGFLQLYKGTLSQVRALASYLWTNDFLTNLVKVTQDPLDIIMSLYMYPFSIPTNSSREVRAGNVETNIIMGVPERQIFEINCGTFRVPSFYGTYLDYEPFTKCEIILPYCGTYSVSLDDISGKEVAITYRIDLLTGSCAAYVIVDGSVHYMFTGMCAVNIPITSQSFINNYSSLLNLVGVGASALSNPTIAAASDVAANVMQCKPTISRGGSAASNVGFMGLQKPCFIFTVPRVAIPKGLAKHNGYPIFATYKLSELTGYTEIETILVSDFGRATKEEVDEIEKLLKGGVIL